MACPVIAYDLGASLAKLIKNADHTNCQIAGMSFPFLPFAPPFPPPCQQGTNHHTD